MKHKRKNYEVQQWIYWCKPT